MYENKNMAKSWFIRDAFCFDKKMEALISFFLFTLILHA
jgi:hypothetical protein